jgi:hypothetical protein
MIGELELELAIAEASETAAHGERVGFLAAAIDIRPVAAYARRFGEVADAKHADDYNAGGAGFMLGFRLGVLAARHERMDA